MSILEVSILEAIRAGKQIGVTRAAAAALTHVDASSRRLARDIDALEARGAKYVERK